jgi:hypothetical protein
MVAHTCNPSTWKWRQKDHKFKGQPELHSKILSQTVKGWGYSLGVKHLPGMRKILGFIPSAAKEVLKI